MFFEVLCSRLGVDCEVSRVVGCSADDQNIEIKVCKAWQSAEIEVQRAPKEAGEALALAAIEVQKMVEETDPQEEMPEPAAPPAEIEVQKMVEETDPQNEAPESAAPSAEIEVQK
eukprot:117326-Amphidinium_carterae.1